MLDVQSLSKRVTPSAIGISILSVLMLLQLGVLPGRGDLEKLNDAIEALDNTIVALNLELQEARSDLERFQAVYEERERHR